MVGLYSLMLRFSQVWSSLAMPLAPADQTQHIYIGNQPPCSSVVVLVLDDDSIKLKDSIIIL